ncbi:MAG TPA: tautomerase family protein [Bradyrhizobium sp.]|uniref:tautomerase family protein n=1 Tax=Bradyrhizobium sp. TaxID=376 RepID=UPI002BB09900|nr:tautomerase family protein [Bradyrhizobium sp.]HLZ05789.1 tautomerase family protein [Bradyrhizobium sp.]
MPHVVVKLHSGRTREQKTKLAAAITQAVTSALGSAEDAISVGIEDVAPADWTERVFKPDILGKAETIYKQPGYHPL